MGFWADALALAQAKYLALMDGTADKVVIGGTEYTLKNSKDLLDEIERLEPKATAETAAGGSSASTPSRAGGRRIYPTLGRP